jgi:hypothetical protein
MSIIIQGNGGLVDEVWGSTFRGLRVHSMPLEYGSNGSYRSVLFTNQMLAGMAADSEIWQMRWTHSTKLCVVSQHSIAGLGCLAAFTAGFGSFRLMFSRSWTVDGSGGTDQTPTGDGAKVRTSMASSAMGALRISQTDALTAGTKTNDTDPIGAFTCSFSNAANTQHVYLAYLLGANNMTESDGDHPIVLAQNEGLSLVATVPATGVWQAAVSCWWTEVDTF